MDYTIIHEAKSSYAYLYDKDTIHIRLKATKGKVKSVRLVFGDPFHWGPSSTDDTWEWQVESSDSISMKKEYETLDFDHFFIAAKPHYKRMKYAFIINEEFIFGCREKTSITKNSIHNLSNYFNFPYINKEDLFDAPKWVEDQIWYSIFPERFCNGDSSINKEGTLEWGATDTYSNKQLFGGDLKGIISKLPYLKEIGFTGIYMTPIFKADSTHKYDTIDYYKIDEAFGTNEDFKELVDTAHSLGIKIMLDAVFNHAGFRHPFFQDVLKKGTDSIYYDCFYVIDKDKNVLDFPVDENGFLDRKYAHEIHLDKSKLNYRTFAFTPYMPKLNTCHPIMKEYLLDIATYWIKNYDIDGWRLDVSNEVSHTFWRDFRRTVKGIKKDAYIVGENWDNSYPWLMGDQYDAVMNYELLFPIWNFFGLENKSNTNSATMFMYTINKVLTDYPKNVLKAMYNLVDSHDTARILETCGNNPKLVLLPYLFLFTFPGAPSIYYGGEIGLSGKHDPDNRRCMIWDESKQNKEILHHVKTLIKLRNEYSAFKSTEYNWLHVDDDKNVIIFQKENLYFILSNTKETVSITLPFELQQRSMQDIYHQKRINFDNCITLSNYEFLILKK